MSSSDKTSTDNQFSGLWDRTGHTEEVKAVAEKLANTLPEKGASRKVKPWGIRSVVLNFVVFLIVQVVFSFVVIGIAASNGQVTAEGEVDSTALANPLVIFFGGLTMYVVWVGGMWLTTRFKGQNSFKKDYWVSFKWYDPLLGLAVAIGLMLFVFGAQWLAADVLGLDLSAADNGSTFSSLTGFWGILVAILVAVILGPLCEELFFRGYLFQAIPKSIRNYSENVNSETDEGGELKVAAWLVKYQYVFALIISSVFFGLMHFPLRTDDTGALILSAGTWFLVGITGFLGLVFGLLAIRLKRIGVGIFGHILYNGGTLLLAFTMGG